MQWSVNDVPLETPLFPLTPGTHRITGRTDRGSATATITVEAD